MSLEISRALTEAQSSKLKSQISQIIRDRSEDASDLIDYVLAMVVNGKNVEYIVNELKDMEMDFCSPQASEDIGRVVVQFLKNGSRVRNDERSNNASVRDERGRDAEDLSRNQSGRSGSGGERVVEEKARIISLKKVNQTSNALTMSGALGTKPSKGNVLTMSGALGASRQGGRVSGKDLSPTTKTDKMKEGYNRDHVGGGRGRLEDARARGGGRRVVHDSGSRQDGRGGGGGGGGQRSMASEAFKRLSQHLDRDRERDRDRDHRDARERQGGGGGGRGRGPASGGKFMDRRMEEHRGGRGRGHDRGHDRSHDRDRIGNRGGGGRGRIGEGGGIGRGGSGPGRGGSVGDRSTIMDGRRERDHRYSNRDGDGGRGGEKGMASSQAWGRKNDNVSTERGRDRNRRGEDVTSSHMQGRRIEQGPSKRARMELKDSHEPTGDMDKKDLLAATKQNQEQQELQHGQQEPHEYGQEQYEYANQEQYGYGQEQYGYAGQEQYGYYDWSWDDSAYYYDPYYDPYYWGGRSSSAYYSGRGRGRGRGRGGRGHGSEERAGESTPDENQPQSGEDQPAAENISKADDAATNDPSTLAAAQVSPSPLVAAQFGTKLSYSGGRGFHGGRGRGRGTWTRGGGGVAAKLAAMSWSRAKNAEGTPGEENNQTTDEQSS